MSEDESYLTQSQSWLVAAAEMAQVENPKVKKVYKPFVPSRNRMSNMIRGERRTINMQAVLYPGRDTVVRVGRHNARVDEGYNEVVALNGQEVADMFNGWVVVMDSVSNGEAFIIVRNNSEQAISLPAGALTIAIRPAICLPRILTRSDMEKMGSPEEDANRPQMAMAVLPEIEPVEEDYPTGSEPRTFFSWNCNGLTQRVKSGDLEEKFYPQVESLDPDIISLQEIRLQCEPDQPGVVMIGSTGEQIWRRFLEPLWNDYDAYLSLSSLKYGGQAVLVKKSLNKPIVTYNMLGQNGHYGSGRFVKLSFSTIVVRSIYAPFNGVGKPEQLERRAKWDDELCRETWMMGDGGKGRIYMGDFNAIYRDSDMSPHPEFWRSQGPQDITELDKGFGGTTRRERESFQTILELGGLADTYIHPTKRERQGSLDIPRTG